MILKNIILIYVYLGIGTCQRVDLTRVDESYGTEVVEAVINILRRSCIFFPDDMLFLRRQAYADTKDGTDPFTYKINYKGGIWQIDESDFNATKTDPALAQYRLDIYKTLYIDWTSVSYNDLRQPLLSALATQLSAVLNSGRIPSTIILQASLWSNQGQKDLDVFLNAVKDLDKNSLLKQNVDIVFVLDSSASMSEADFNKSKHYVQNFISELDVNSGLAHVGAVAFSNVVYSSVALNNGKSASQLRKAISNIIYQPGGTNTFDALEFVQDHVFQTGSRLNAAKVVVLVTDGRSADNVATISAAQKLRDDGVTVFAVGVGDLIDKRELSFVVSEPSCSHLQTVGNYSELPANSHSGALLAMNAPVALKPGVYEFNCSSDVTSDIMETPGRPKTVQITSIDGAVDVFGSGSAVFVPNSAIYSFNESVTKEFPLDIYVRDGSKISLAFRNDNCQSSFKVKIAIGDQIHTGDNKICIEAGLVSRCGLKDIVDSPFIIKGTPEPTLPVNVCGKTDSFTASYPGKTDRYLMCNAGRLIAVYCLPDQKFDPALTLCVHSNSIATTITTKQTPTVQIAKTTTYMAPPTTPKPVANPCTHEHISQGLMIWAYPSDDRKYIKCGIFANSGTIFDCGEHKYYSAAVQTCLYRDVVASLYGPNGVTYDGHANPCLKHYAGDVQYHPYPGDPHRFIQCDAYGDAYVKTCPQNEVWEPQINNCIPTGFKYQTAIG